MSLEKENRIILEIFKYIKAEESFLESLERGQNSSSDNAHTLEEEANVNYEQRMNYINAVQAMREYRAGLVSHHEYVSNLQIRYMEMNNKVNKVQE